MGRPPGRPPAPFSRDAEATPYTAPTASNRPTTAAPLGPSAAVLVPVRASAGLPSSVRPSLVGTALTLQVGTGRRSILPSAVTVTRLTAPPGDAGAFLRTPAEAVTTPRQPRTVVETDTLMTTATKLKRLLTVRPVRLAVQRPPRLPKAVRRRRLRLVAWITPVPPPKKLAPAPIQTVRPTSNGSALTSTGQRRQAMTRPPRALPTPPMSPS